MDDPLTDHHCASEQDIFYLQPEWVFVADAVMGGVSRGGLQQTDVAGRQSARLTGSVSLENDGGFLQMAFDLAGGAVFDASRFKGLCLDVWGNDQNYDLRLRTDYLRKPWQSYRATFQARSAWHRVTLPFEAFLPNKTELPLNPARLRRVGVLAIGRVFSADVAVARIGFYA